MVLGFGTIGEYALASSNNGTVSIWSKTQIDTVGKTSPSGTIPIKGISLTEIKSKNYIKGVIPVQGISQTGFKNLNTLKFIANLIDTITIVTGASLSPPIGILTINAKTITETQGKVTPSGTVPIQGKTIFEIKTKSNSTQTMFFLGLSKIITSLKGTSSEVLSLFGRDILITQSKVNSSYPAILKSISDIMVKSNLGPSVNTLQIFGKTITQIKGLSTILAQGAITGYAWTTKIQVKAQGALSFGVLPLLTKTFISIKSKSSLGGLYSLLGKTISQIKGIISPSGIASISGKTINQIKSFNILSGLTSMLSSTRTIISSKASILGGLSFYVRSIILTQSKSSVNGIISILGKTLLELTTSTLIMGSLPLRNILSRTFTQIKAFGSLILTTTQSSLLFGRSVIIEEPGIKGKLVRQTNIKGITQFDNNTITNLIPVTIQYPSYLLLSLPTFYLNETIIEVPEIKGDVKAKLIQQPNVKGILTLTTNVKAKKINN